MGIDNASLPKRKAKHLEICVQNDKFDVEGGSTGFESVHFIHNAMPEISFQDVDSSTQFLGYKIAAPLLISCMTGGSPQGFRVNRELAKAAQCANIPVGMGSIRILLENPELTNHFELKKEAPDVPIIANIGAVQLPSLNLEHLFELCRKLEVDALAIHLNPGQEIFQPDGDTDFRGFYDVLRRLCDFAFLPIIIKETGFGMSPSLIHSLLNAGASYVDIAGSGGTNWITVESHRSTPLWGRVANSFQNWGIPTALALAAVEPVDDRIIASGGIRSGTDIAKSIAMGARMTGSALPFIRAVHSGGQDAVVTLIDDFITTLRATMFLTGSSNISHLRKAKYWLEPAFAEQVTAFCKADGKIHQDSE